MCVLTWIFSRNQSFTNGLSFSPDPTFVRCLEECFHGQVSVLCHVAGLGAFFGFKALTLSFEVS